MMPAEVAVTSQIRVRYADTDQMRFVYYAKYFEYFEQGRSDLLREIGMSYSAIEAKGYYLPVVESHARYFHPAQYDDLLEVKTIVREEPTVKIYIHYEVRKYGEKKILTDGYTIHSFVRADTGRPTRPPIEFVELFRGRF